MTELRQEKLLASNGDREQAVDVLKSAFAEGRLEEDEFGERLGQIYASRTRGDLAALTADLPDITPPTSATVPQPSSVPARDLARHPGWSAPAIVSLICGIAADLYPASVAAILAMVLAVVALMRIHGTRQRGRGMAVAGFFLGLFGLLSVLGFAHFG